jgi:protoporphyrinogen oxidase
MAAPMPTTSSLATLPLNRLVELTQISVEAPTDPYTSVLVLNIGAVRGPKCPADHWLYNPDAQSGFHRVGFYSNVDVSFLPKSAQEKGDRVSIYVERAYLGGDKPTAAEIADYSAQVVKELQDWGYITTPEVVDPTWIDVAYTWMRPQSLWRQQALAALEAHQIYPIGRYGRWVFQGIADSIKDGLFIGSSFKA